MHTGKTHKYAHTHMDTYKFITIHTYGHKNNHIHFDTHARETQKHCQTKMQTDKYRQTRNVQTHKPMNLQNQKHTDTRA